MIIHHQDPDQPSLLQEILQSYTEMPVVMVEEGGLKALPNTVYLKPPDYDCSILQGSLILLEPVNASGTRMAIDIFFWHLVEVSGGQGSRHHPLRNGERLNPGHQGPEGAHGHGHGPGPANS
jgi:chemotaxis response regulator CheB